MHTERDLLNKSERISLLLDFYGELLSETQKRAMEMFYNEDLSLSEIAEETGITRQGVRDRIVKAERILTDTEKKLGLAARFEQAREGLDYLVGGLERLHRETGAPVEDLVEVAGKLL